MGLIYWIFFIGYWALLIVTVLLVLTDSSNNNNPSKALAWIALIALLPVVGMILYYALGFDRRRVGASEKDFRKFMDEVIPHMPEEAEAYAKNFDRYFDGIDPDYKGLARMLENNHHSKVLFGSDVEIITDGNRKLDMLIGDMENATDHIHLEYFLFRRDEISKKIRGILMRKAEEGVKVRFIYDNIANIDIFPSYYNKMRKSGVEVNAFTKISLSSIRRSLNNRNHRKLAVIDGKIGYVGGMNITNQTQRWRDAHLRIQGQGVHGLQMNFFHVWHGSGGTLPVDLRRYFPAAKIFSGNLMQIVPEVPDSRFPYFALSIVKAISNARKYIYIQTPYFLPTEDVKRALKTAVLSGVEVRLMTSRKSDFMMMDWAIQANYTEMLEAGVHIHEIQDYFSHAKSMVMDDYLSIIGSGNLDYRSLELNFEINSFMYDPGIAARNRDIFIRDMEDCRQLTLEEWSRRPWWKKTLQTVMRFFSPLL